jgi:hypothetical protein
MADLLSPLLLNFSVSMGVPIQQKLRFNGDVVTEK